MSLSSSAHASSNLKSTRILACVLCQHRKIKCDRTFPCANCVKANVTCTPSTPAPARKRRRPNQDLQERLARCEELLKEYATAKPDVVPAQPAAPEHFDTPVTWSTPGKLFVEDDGAVRFTDSYMIGTVYEELKAMREIVDEDNIDAAPSPEPSTPDENADMIMGADSPSTSIEELQPSPGHIFRLWQIYLERVNPLTKIIHVPSLQPFLVEAATGSQNIPKNVGALLFAIYTLTAVSMTPDECLNVLGYTRQEALQRFSAGVRISLTRLGFLKTHDLESLQALVIYLISLQNRYNQHAAWILNGVAIRIAHKMGLHRDGESLGLSPFETEMRRRLWWQVIMLDSKYAMISGLSHSLLPGDWDTQEPKNINDADLFPSATEPIQHREGPTEMIMVLLTNKVARFLVQTPNVEPIILLSDPDSIKGPGAPTTEQLHQVRTLMRSLAGEMLDIIQKYCDPSAGPIHVLAMDMKLEILTKIESMLTPKKETRPGTRAATPSDHAFRIAVDANAHGIEEHMRTKDSPFAWFARLHFHSHVFQYLVGQLCLRTEGEQVEKAWELVPMCYELYPELFEVSQKANYQVATFMLKAWRKRQKVLLGRTGMIPETPEYIAKLQSVMPQDEKSDTSSGPLTETTNPTPSDDMVTDTPVDELLGIGQYLDPNSIDWDMWGGMVAPTTAMSAFGGFGMGPSTEW